jgi:hypothetical protein
MPGSSSIYKSISIGSPSNQEEMSKRYSDITLPRYMYQNDPPNWSERYSDERLSETVKMTHLNGQNDPYIWEIPLRKKNLNFFCKNLDRPIGREYILL